jgi:hypothetical protein
MTTSYRWHPVDGSPVIAARLDVSAGTVRRTKVLLTGFRKTGS